MLAGNWSGSPFPIAEQLPEKKTANPNASRPTYLAPLLWREQAKTPWPEPEPYHHADGCSCHAVAFSKILLRDQTAGTQDKETTMLSQPPRLIWSHNFALGALVFIAPGLLVISNASFDWYPIGILRPVEDSPWWAVSGRPFGTCQDFVISQR
jgi:hypothetical protein